MKTTITHLPEANQKELQEIVAVIQERIKAEMIILFGSFARGDWVDDKYKEDGTTYEYKSDYDLLVVLDNEEQARIKETEKRWRYKIRRNSPKETPLNIIFHGIEYLNAEIEQGNYFFMDVLNDGIVLFNSGKHKLATPKPLNQSQRKEKAKVYFEKWFENANEFMIDYENAFNRGSYCQAAFMLHQATERYYMTVLLVYTDYKPKFHDLERLDKMVCQLDKRFKDVFKRSNAEEERLFNLLKKAYIDSRYKLDYEIKREELEWLSERVRVLRGLTEVCCEQFLRIK